MGTTAAPNAASHAIIHPRLRAHETTEEEVNRRDSGHPTRQFFLWKSAELVSEVPADENESNAALEKTRWINDNIEFRKKRGVRAALITKPATHQT
jgi:hypothetical protein